VVRHCTAYTRPAGDARRSDMHHSRPLEIADSCTEMRLCFVWLKRDIYQHDQSSHRIWAALYL
jgi:hypothetical protein